MISIFIPKCGKSVDIDFSALPEVVQQHIIEYGLKQKLNDCHSQFTEKSGDKDYQEKAWTMVEKTVEALKAGEIRQAKAGADAEIQLVYEYLKLQKVSMKKEGFFDWLEKTGGKEAAFKIIKNKWGEDQKQVSERVNAERLRVAQLKSKKTDLDSLL